MVMSEEDKRRGSVVEELELADEAELARIIGKLEDGKKLTARETLYLLPYYYLISIKRRLREDNSNVEKC